MKKNAAILSGRVIAYGAFFIIIAAIVIVLLLISRAPDSPTGSAGFAQEEVAVLIDRWVRPDGGYILDLQSISSDGKLTASYYNPNPIRISRAQVTPQGEVLRIYVEFDDVNYHGSNYTLVYNEQYDALVGIYFQAKMQQEFEVVFVRADD